MSEAANNEALNLAYKPSRREFAAFGAIAAMGSGVAAPLAAASASEKPRSLIVKNEGGFIRPENG